MLRFHFLILAALAGFCFSSRGNFTNGLVVHLRMDEASGFTAFDSTTNAHHAALTNFPAGNAQWVPGRTNNALELNAATNNQRAIISDSDGRLNFGAKPSPTFSLALWVKGTPGVQSPGAGVLAKGIGRGKEQFVIDVFANNFRFFVRSSAGASFLASGPAVDGSWQHLTATYDSVNPVGGLKLYVNGLLYSSVNAPTTLTNHTHEISLGSREDNASSGYNLPFFGTLDDVRIYDRVLSAADVAELCPPAPPVPDSEFTALRLRWLEMLNGGTNLNTADPDVINSLSNLSVTAQSLWNTMDKSPSRTFLWNDLASLTNNSTHIWYTYDRLKTITLAYATAGGPLYSNATLRVDLFSALDWMYANFYNETKSEYDNWWHWEIGTPLRLNDITVLLYDQLTGTQITNYMNAVNKFTPAPNDTAANLVWKATVVAVRGVIAKENAKLIASRNSLSSVFPYVTSGDGYYTDGSFIQHGVHPYTGSYGSSLIFYLSPIMHLLHDSPWEITDSKQTNVFNWVHDSYEPVIYKGAMMDMVRGRAMARAIEPDHWAGHESMSGIIRLAQFAPPNDATAFKSMAKYWIQTDTARSFLANTALGMLPLAKNILSDTNIPSRGELIGHYHFGSMDRVVHLRPGFGLGLSMSSSRIANFESINAENLHGWYMGEGVTYIYDNDLTQFSDNFWPTVNAYRLPGTTVDTQTRSDGSGSGVRPVYNWVGGAALDDWGVAGMQLDAWNSTLTAKKSWFMFDDEIVCLGAGINSTDNRTIETIVENRKLSPVADNALIINGGTKPATLGWSETLSNVSWAHLEGNAAGADVGYYFPQPASLQGSRTSRTGTWYGIDHLEITNSFTRNYLELWFNHGTNPVNAAYSYVLLPGKSAARVADYAAYPNIKVLQNSTNIQAVKDVPLGVTGVNFWEDGAQSDAGITVNKKASVVMQVANTNLSVAIADPTQTNVAGITVTFTQSVAQVVSVDPGVSVIQTNPLQLSVATANARGKSFRARFTLGTPPGITTFGEFQNQNFLASQLTDANISGPLADPDHDGLNNLFEYALLLNPWQPDSGTLQARLESGKLTLNYVRRKAATDLSFIVEVSNDLQTWDGSQTQFDQSIEFDTTSAQGIRITDKSASSAHATRYFRLRIELQQ